MREVVLDTETTGLDPFTGDRLVEIGCVELFNSIPTGETFHAYINPERDMPDEAFRVHGLSHEFLQDKPKFVDVAERFLDFISDAKIVIHNAEFDIKFINHELQMVDRTPISMDQVIDTLAIARRKHPGSPNSLDALCSRYRIDNSRRTKHGALLDSELLAEVYLELMGGRQVTLSLQHRQEQAAEQVSGPLLAKRNKPIKRQLDASTRDKHASLVEKIGEKALWASSSGRMTLDIAFFPHQCGKKYHCSISANWICANPSRPQPPVQGTNPVKLVKGSPCPSIGETASCSSSSPLA